MNHYPHHIGDFDKATRHLTRLERSVYRDLIELYYDTETVLSLDLAQLCRRILARSNEESTAVEQVLNEFFTKTANGWFHQRCDEEIEAFHSMTTQKALAGKASAEARRKKRDEKLKKLNGNLTPVEQPFNSVATAGNGTPTNLEPRTYNLEPDKEKIEKEKSGRGTRLKTDWQPGDADIEFCKTNRPDLQWQLVRERFVDHWTAKTGQGATKIDWSATWRNWVRNERGKPVNASNAKENERDRIIRELYAHKQPQDDFQGVTVDV